MIDSEGELFMQVVREVLCMAAGFMVNKLLGKYDISLLSSKGILIGIISGIVVVTALKMVFM